MNTKDERPFSEKHPKASLAIGVILLLILAGIAIVVIYLLSIFLWKGTSELLQWISSITSKMDAVIIVTLITAAVSIVSVIISSVVSKRIEYKKNREAYLAQKREGPYGDFVEMVYKLQMNAKD